MNKKYCDLCTKEITYGCSALERQIDSKDWVKHFRQLNFTFYEGMKLLELCKDCAISELQKFSIKENNDKNKSRNS